jgi:hypothetical protein
MQIKIWLEGCKGVPEVINIWKVVMGKHNLLLWEGDSVDAKDDNPTRVIDVNEVQSIEVI